MPMDRSLYPPNWEEIAKGIKDAAGWKCQECGKPCKRPEQTWNEFSLEIDNDGWSVSGMLWSHLQQWILTVAHIDGIFTDLSPTKLIALCADCHRDHTSDWIPLRRQLHKERVQQLQIKGFSNTANSL